MSKELNIDVTIHELPKKSDEQLLVRTGESKLNDNDVSKTLLRQKNRMTKQKDKVCDEKKQWIRHNNKIAKIKQRANQNNEEKQQIRQEENNQVKTNGQQKL